MSDDIDSVLAEAQLRSKFDAAVHEFADLMAFFEKYVDSEEFIVDTGEDFSEDEMDALDKVTEDLSQIEEQLESIHVMIYGGIG